MLSLTAMRTSIEESRTALEQGLSLAAPVFVPAAAHGTECGLLATASAFVHVPAPRPSSRPRLGGTLSSSGGRALAPLLATQIYDAQHPVPS